MLKDYKTSFYKAGLVPAANVYFTTGSEDARGHGASCLRKEVAGSGRACAQRQRPVTAAGEGCSTCPGIRGNMSLPRGVDIH